MTTLDAVRAGLNRTLFAPVRPAGRARHRALVLGLLLAAGSIPFSLLRQPGSALDNLWAEDGAEFLGGAYARPLHEVLLTPYAGYASVYPRLVGAVGAHVAVRDAPVVLALGGALACAAAVLFTVVATEGHLSSLGARVVLGAAVALFPLGGVEVAASTCNAQWYFIATAFWAVLWRSRSALGGAFAGVLLALGASNDPLLGLFLPIVVLRAFALPRWRDNLPGIGLVVGLLAQVPSLVHPTLTAKPVRPGLRVLAESWLYRGPTEALLGPQLPVRLGWPGIALGAGALLLAIVAAGVLGGRGAWLAVVATVYSAALYMITVDLRWNIGMAPFTTMVFASRYNLVPALLCLTVLLLGVDGITRRVSLAGRSLTAVVAAGVLVMMLAAVHIAYPRLPSWSAQLPAARAACGAAPGSTGPLVRTRGGVRTVAVQGAPTATWITNVPCRALVGRAG